MAPILHVPAAQLGVDLTLVRGPISLIRRLFPQVGQAFALVGGGFAQVRTPISLIGSVVAQVGLVVAPGGALVLFPQGIGALVEVALPLAGGVGSSIEATPGRCCRSPCRRRVRNGAAVRTHP
ncbi:hypothetical protein [Actinoplanes sp. NPDC051859]|uniref:hypothetical protein n=1 Tax=Actinoplanes sp. NPDC051859 TaxID=3363909 RepID=UPI0037A28D0A